MDEVMENKRPTYSQLDLENYPENYDTFSSNNSHKKSENEYNQRIDNNQSSSNTEFNDKIKTTVKPSDNGTKIYEEKNVASDNDNSKSMGYAEV